MRALKCMKINNSFSIGANVSATSNCHSKRINMITLEGNSYDIDGLAYFLDFLAVFFDFDALLGFAFTAFLALVSFFDGFCTFTLFGFGD